jgi:RsmE family RNA methyltransferase
MQLFITDFSIKNNLLYIEEERISNQIRKVLRWKNWYVFEVQKNNWEFVIRIEVSIINFQKDVIICDILKTTKKKNKFSELWIIISILNKYDKMNLLVQKLSELWISNIYFWKSDRSVITKINDNKYERFWKISLEAVEQSKWWIVPNIKIVDNLESILWNNSLILLDMDWVDFHQIDWSELNNKKLLIWPEWWFSDKDFEYLKQFFYKKINIWENIYRAETAWIIWWWLLKNMVE